MTTTLDIARPCLHRNKSPLPSFIRSPRYIHHEYCYEDELYVFSTGDNAPKGRGECGSGTLLLWKEGDQNRFYAIRLRCKSWRCPVCRPKVNARDYHRIREGIRNHPGGYVYMVLTLHQRKWPEKYAAYAALSRLWRKLRGRIERRWGKLHYVAVVERHRNGWPHIHLAIQNDALWGECADGKAENFSRRQLKPHAVASGFGFVTSIERVRSTDAIAGYLIKLTSDAESTGDAQVPFEAPKGFRRLRASQGFLPPLHRPSEYKGRVIEIDISRFAESLVRESGEDDAWAPWDRAAGFGAAIADTESPYQKGAGNGRPPRNQAHLISGEGPRPTTPELSIRVQKARRFVDAVVKSPPGST
jgi:hypothetical protein